MKKTIVISEDGMFASEPMNYPTVVQLACSGIVGAAKQIIEAEGTKANDADEQKAMKEKLEGELFDITNLMFSQALETAFPTMELRPDLTAEAIMEKENEIAAYKVSKLRSKEDDEDKEGEKQCGEDTQN